MSNIVELKTERLLLRQWKKEDYPLFAKLNADPAVMAFYPNVLTEDESNAMAQKIEALMAKQSWGFWAVEILAEKQFIGFVGLNNPSYDLPVTPCVEIGWRLAKEYWGRGYATESAKASLKFAFDELNLNEVYSFTPVGNKRSWSVMQRLGMKNTDSNFEHPMIPVNHPLGEHVLYKISREEYFGLE